MCALNNDLIDREGRIRAEMGSQRPMQMQVRSLRLKDMNVLLMCRWDYKFLKCGPVTFLNLLFFGDA